ncbi:MAG: hypothetical protein Kow0037_08150 [Calditrichia bacterium]
MNTKAIFVSDLHGHWDRFEKLLQYIRQEQPEGVFIGGDILPIAYARMKPPYSGACDFLSNKLFPALARLKEELKENYPAIFLIPGNDDPRVFERFLMEGEANGIWKYVALRWQDWQGFRIFGYPFVPPTPFLLKDWERYDVSRFVDPGCVPPDEGRRTVEVSIEESRYQTIAKDLEEMASGRDFHRSIFLFHSPPYQTLLDRAALDGKMVDHVLLDVNIGSIAIKRFLENKQPYLTLHGHVHESARLTGAWQQKIGRTVSYNAAHDGEELSIILFDAKNPENARRLLL